LSSVHYQKYMKDLPLLRDGMSVEFTIYNATLATSIGK
jgi:hypothetical protein